MDQSDLQRFVVGVFERLGIRYFITGSTATIFFGEPRFTNDLDVVAVVAEPHVRPLLAAFNPDDFYVSEFAVRDAIARRSQFNIIHPESGLKVDVIVPDLSGFDRQRLDRAIRVNAGPGFEAVFSTPEDVILKKMEFFREGGSDKHLRDITGVLKVRGDLVDRAYIEEWATRLGVADVWRAILQRLGEARSDA